MITPELEALISDHAKVKLKEHMNGYKIGFVDFPINPNSSHTTTTEEICISTEEDGTSISTPESQHEFVVGGIIDRRWSRSKNMYEWLVNWEGYGEDENTWEPEEVFRDGEIVNDIFLDYEQAHPRLQKRRPAERKMPASKKNSSKKSDDQVQKKK